MTLTYLDRTTYRAKGSPEVEDELRRRFGDFFLLPEGGSNSAAVRGAAELPAELSIPYDVVCCACGTGGTLAGIAAGLPPGKAAGPSVNHARSNPRGRAGGIAKPRNRTRYSSRSP